MFERLELMRLAHGLAAHAAQRQALVAQNVANADTPGYRARDLAPFESVFRETPSVPLKVTRPGHVGGAPSVIAAEGRDAPDAEEPNGNTVSLEDQMLKAAEIRHQHDLALGVYGSALSILRSSIGRR